MKEECGVFAGILFDQNNNIIKKTIKALSNIQHRGIQSCGVCVSFGDNKEILFKDKGLVCQVLSSNNTKDILGNIAIGHVRYSTIDGDLKLNAQPLKAKFKNDYIYLVHNGHIPNALDIKNELAKTIKFETQTDSEVILKKIIFELEKNNLDINFENIGKILSEFFDRGAYSLCFLYKNKIFAFRDKFGFRPLWFCKTNDGFFVASEDIAFKDFEINKKIEIISGFGVEFDLNNFEIKQFDDSTKKKKCVFEHIYFSHINSNIFNHNIFEQRKIFGKLIAKKNIHLKNKCDIVVPVVNSGICAAMGVSYIFKMPLVFAILKNKKQNRTFIEVENLRNKKIEQKFKIKEQLIKNKRILLVDDSMVRGNTAKNIVSKLYEAGAKEIHMLIASPMLKDTCSFGVDIRNKNELIATTFKDAKSISKELGLNSLCFIDLTDLKNIYPKDEYCFDCFL